MIFKNIFLLLIHPHAFYLLFEKEFSKKISANIILKNLIFINFLFFFIISIILVIKQVFGYVDLLFYPKIFIILIGLLLSIIISIIITVF